MTTRKIDHYEYSVTGSSSFPVDMLRYDQAWPADSTSAVALTTRDCRQGVTVHLRGRRAPTVGRWNSFGWQVTQGREVRT